MAGEGQGSWRWWLALLLAVGLLFAINRAGFIGGANDDWHYLTAARCWVAHGPCLPLDHWQGRWPVIAPLAAVITLFGESRAAISVAPLAANLAALFCLALIGNRLFGKPVGFISALLLAAVPDLSLQLTEPRVEGTELAFIFVGCLAAIEWQRRRQHALAFLAGLAFSLAFQVRETAAVAVLLVGAWLVTRRDKPTAIEWAAALGGFGIPLLIEFAIFWSATGDPFWRHRLSIRHTQIPSNQLLGPIDRNHAPFFNKAYIANWRREPGIHVHWLIDGFVNLFADVFGGLSLWVVPLLGLTFRNQLTPADRKSAAVLYGGAMIYCAVLIYAFAIDPKPRMMLAPLSLTSLALGLVTWRLFRRGRQTVAISVWIICGLLALTTQYTRPRGERLEYAARQWIAAHPDQIEIDPLTQKYLALVPEAQRLPSALAYRPYLMTVGDGCDDFVVKTHLRTAIALRGSYPVSHLQRLLKQSNEICLFEYLQPVSGQGMRELIEQYQEER